MSGLSIDVGQDALLVAEAEAAGGGHVDDDVGALLADEADGLLEPVERHGGLVVFGAHVDVGDGGAGLIGHVDLFGDLLGLGGQIGGVLLGGHRPGRRHGDDELLHTSTSTSCLSILPARWVMGTHHNDPGGRNKNDPADPDHDSTLTASSTNNSTPFRYLTGEQLSAFPARAVRRCTYHRAARTLRTLAARRSAPCGSERRSSAGPCSLRL